MAITNVTTATTNHQNRIPPVTFSNCQKLTSPIDRDNDPKILAPYQNFRYCSPLRGLKTKPKIAYRINKNNRLFDISKVKEITKTVKQFIRIVPRLTKCGSFNIPNKIVTPDIINCATIGSRKGKL